MYSANADCLTKEMLLTLFRTILLRGCLFITILLLFVFLFLPLILATVTVLRQQLRKYYYQFERKRNPTKKSSNDVNFSLFQSSALYFGRVWHTRFQPIKHSFTYPIFIFGLNFDEIYYDDTTTVTSNVGSDESNNSDVCRFGSMLWPLSLIVSFNPNDHLKNDEGNNTADSKVMNTIHDSPTVESTQPQQKSFPDRIFHFIAERTNGSFQPNRKTHSIFLVTHLTYYGYCFNPVSFYYIHERHTSQKLVCVIGEVSNTPWNEMYCYVLHPNSKDQVHCSGGGNVDSSSGDERNVQTPGSQRKTDTMKYIFSKQFHVSPFMEMNYNYEWSFTNFSIQPQRNPFAAAHKMSTHDAITATSQRTTSIHVINNLRPILATSTKTNTPGTTDIPSSSNGNNNNSLQFSAVMHVHRYSMHPYRIVYYMIMYPMYCMIIQVWIHIQAFYLFAKGISYQPHPLGSETSISRFIGRMMVPFFYVRDHCRKATTTGTKQQCPTTSSTTTNGSMHKSKAS